MTEKIIKITELKSGFVLSRDIYNSKGAIILSKETVLTDSLIDRLAVLHVSNVYVNNTNHVIENTYIPESDSLSLKKSKKQYFEKIKVLKNVFEDIQNPQNIEIAQNVSLTIMESEESTGDLLRCMRQLKEVDNYIYTHSLNVASVCHLIGTWMKLDKTNLDNLILAGLLHDIGKTKLPKDILEKADFTDKERELFGNHPLYGYEMLIDISSFSKEVLSGILMHHEREDGSGYPSGLKSDEIPLIAKIVGIADIYCKITIDRIYERSDTPFTVFKLFEAFAPKKFDPLTTHILLKNISQYYLGDKVLLSNGKTGTIIIIDEEFISRPIIHCVDGSLINLRFEKDITIEKMLYTE